MAVPNEIGEAGQSRLERITRAIHDEMADPSIEYLFGRKYLDQHGTDRRIVYVPNGGTIAAPNKIGADVGSHRVRMCRARVSSVEAHAYAEDIESADDLLDALIAAVCLVVPDAVFGSYDDVSDEVGEAGETLRSYKVICRFQLRLPVPVEVKKLRTIVAIEHECGMLQPDGSIAPQPD